MSSIFEKAAELNLDRSGWQLVKFGDIAIQQKKTVDRDNTELTRYVKGEHMYSEDIHLREWGELKDEYLGPAFIRKFEEGDILYGSRRTYLRKVVVAPFEGITSNTTFVIKANEELIDKRLLPYLMLSEGFSQHSIQNSKGSVNPYINWKDLADYELLLPTLASQQEIAKLLYATDFSLQKLKDLERALLLNLQSMEHKCFSTDSSYMLPLYSVVEKCQSGGTPNTDIKEFYDSGSIPWLTTKLLVADTISIGEKHITKDALLRSATNVLSKGNVLAGTRVGAGKFSINMVDMAFSQDITGLVIDSNKVNVEFLVYQLNSFVFQKKIKPFLQGTTIKGITKEDLLNLDILVPEGDAQKNTIKSISSIKAAIKNTIAKQSALKSVNKSILNQVF